MSEDGAVTPLQQRGGGAEGSVQREDEALARRSNLYAMQAQPCFKTMMPGCLWGVCGQSFHTSMWIQNPTSECKRAQRASAQASPRSLEHVRVCACMCVHVRVRVCELTHTYQLSAIGPMCCPTRHQVGACWRVVRTVRGSAEGVLAHTLGQHAAVLTFGAGTRRHASSTHQGRGAACAHACARARLRSSVAAGQCVSVWAAACAVCGVLWVLVSPKVKGGAQLSCLPCGKTLTRYCQIEVALNFLACPAARQTLTDTCLGVHGWAVGRGRDALPYVEKMAARGTRLS